MHSVVSLSGGVLRINLRERDDHVKVNVNRWHELLVPAAAWLQIQGGGEVVVPHRPGDLT